MYKVFVHYAAPVLGDGVVEVRDATGRCFQLAVNGSEAGGWYPAVMAGMPEPRTELLAGDLTWNNIGEAVVDTVMLVSPDVPCAPGQSEQCQMQDTRALTFISPHSIGEEGDAIKVLVVDDFSTRKVLSVVTYIDGREVYRRARVTPVDLRYMRAGLHQVDTHIFYDDGTRVISSQPISNSSEDLTTYYYVYIASNLRALGFVAGALGLLAISWAMLFMARSAFRKHLWKKEHNLE
jgi:hypothetical protein